MSRSRSFAMFAGILGAAASAIGKLGMDENYTMIASEKICSFDAVIDGSCNVWLLSLIMRIGLLALTLVLNGAMWAIFAESMQELNSGEAVVLNTGTNILFSAFLGWIAFGEIFGMNWWIGAAFVIVGILLMKSDIHEKDE